MSDPRRVKKDRETDQVATLLKSVGMPFANLEDGPDPPDVVVVREGLPSLHIEVTEYHPEDGRVGVEKRWSQLRRSLDDLISRHADLKGVQILPIFKDNRIPSRNSHKLIIDEIVRCARHFLHEGAFRENGIKLSFLPDIPHGMCQPLNNRWFIVPASEWPILAMYVSTLTISKLDFDGYLPTNNPQAQTAYCSPFAEAFLTLLEQKEESMAKAISQGKYARDESALWLLIGCNTSDDLRSRIFGSENLQNALGECGFDFVQSVFDEVWLLDVEWGGRSQRLHPWSPSVYRISSTPST